MINRVPKEITEKLYSAFRKIEKEENKVSPAAKQTINFKGRKSIDLASSLLTELTGGKAFICEPFAGSGSFLLAACKSGCRVVGCELDSYLFSADYILLQRMDTGELSDFFAQVKKNCRTAILSLYETSCCDTKNWIEKLHFDPETAEYMHPTPHRDIKEGKNIILIKPCPVCGEKRKAFAETDRIKLKECEALDTSAFPNHQLIRNSRINITAQTGADRYGRNFTNRAKKALLILQQEISTLPACPERDFLEHCLVASLTLSRTAQYGSGSEYIYQVMRRQAQEKNVWQVFEDKYQAFLRFQKEFSFARLSKNARLEKDFFEDQNISLYHRDYFTQLSQPGYRGKFDLIYTDPPYTDQVPYLERSQLFRDWLRLFYDPSLALTKEELQKEVVVSNAEERPDKHGFEQYYHDVDRMFSLFHQILKPDGLVFFTVNLGSNKYLKTLAEFIDLARKNGFECAVKHKMDKNDYTVRKQAAFLNTISKEMILCFVKLSEDMRYWYVNGEHFEHLLIKFLYEKLKHSGDGLSLSKCVLESEAFYRGRYQEIPTEEFAQKVNRIIHREFYVGPNAMVFIDQNKLYLELEDSSDLFAKLYDNVPIIFRKLDQGEGFPLEELYSEIVQVFLNGDSSILKQILSDSSHESQLQELLHNYCTVGNYQYFLKRPQEASSENEQACDISTMDGYDFEELIRCLLEEEGFCEVIRIGGACDRGVDLMAKKMESGKSVGYIFQCKRWISNVGSTPIQRLHSMMIQMQPSITKAVCITTSDYTVHATTEAENTGVDLVNGPALLARLNLAFPGKYYHGGLKLTKNRGRKEMG